MTTTPKEITFADQCREKLLAGVTKLAAAVKATLGPRGRNVLVYSRWAGQFITKDGVTVANHIALTDDVEDAGAQAVREIAQRTADTAGDGTTTATVLAEAIFREGVRNVAAGSAPMEIRRGIEMATKAALKYVESITRPIALNTDEVLHIATISANGDQEIGGLIAQAVNRVGKDGVIAIEESKTMQTVLEVVEGMQFDRGWISPYFVTDGERMEAVLENCYVLVSNIRLVSDLDVLPLMKRVSDSGKYDKLFVIAADVEESGALQTLVMNKLNGTFQCCAVRAPGFADRRRDFLDDIAVLTGATLLTEEMGIAPKSIKVEQLGFAKKVIVKQGHTTIITEDDKTKPAVQERIAKLRGELEAADIGVAKEKIKERLAKLTGGVAVIRVGAATEAEANEKKFLVEDAMYATRAAVAEGVVPGGGMALLRASSEPMFIRAQIADLYGGRDQGPLSRDIQAGVDILKAALQEPFRAIIINGGGKPDLLAEKLLEQPVEMGYDAQREVICDLYAAGVIDPAKVVREELINATSIAALLLTTEAVISEVPEDKADDGGLTKRQANQMKGALERLKRRARQ